MRGSLGEKIGEGGFADIHAWAPGQVVKLFKAGVAQRVSSQEARMTRAVFVAGGPAPEVLGEVTLEGRVGIVLSRLDGPTLLQLSRSDAITFGQAGVILASLCLSVPRQRDHDGGWSETRRLGRCGPRAGRPRPCVLPHPSVRDRPGSRRQSAAAAHRHCRRAVRVRATGRHVPSGADGGCGALPADRPRLVLLGGRCLPYGSG